MSFKHSSKYTPKSIFSVTVAIFLALSASARITIAEERKSQVAKLGSYAYEAKPDDAAFAKFNPRLAPPPGPLLLKKGDRLAIIGDSITEQKIYSRIIETYLTVCVPQLEIQARQYGWSGERTEVSETNGPRLPEIQPNGRNPRLRHERYPLSSL